MRDFLVGRATRMTNKGRCDASMDNSLDSTLIPLSDIWSHLVSGLSAAVTHPLLRVLTEEQPRQHPLSSSFSRVNGNQKELSARVPRSTATLADRVTGQELIPIPPAWSSPSSLEESSCVCLVRMFSKGFAFQYDSTLVFSPLRISADRIGRRPSLLLPRQDQQGETNKQHND